MPDTGNPIITKTEVPERIQAYYAVNNVDTFLFDRRLHKFVVEDPDNEFKVCSSPEIRAISIRIITKIIHFYSEHVDRENYNENVIPPSWNSSLV